MPRFNIVAGLAISLLVASAAADPWPKRGLAANDDIPIWQFGGSWNGYNSEVNWQYNWDSTTSEKQSFAEFVPMLWGTASDHTTQWFNNAWYWLNNGGSGHLLAFNEPEQSGQSNLTPQQAADAWRTYMEPFVGHAQLGAPAVSNDGYEWLSEFLQACSDCNIDFVPIHWYNDASLESDLENWVNSVCSLTGRQVWLTEFQAYGSIDDQSNFLRSAIPFLDDNDCVYRYAYFGTADNSKVLLENGGPSLSPLGVQYTFSAYGNGDGPN
ncbi:Alkali-sensitive linkage protein 1 [Talaromyces pinophilus]|nr:Alkali-sensitive linkage protein 1 [Talaromyces pinophilus]